MTAEINVFSLCQNTVNDANVMSAERLLLSFGPAEANRAITSLLQNIRTGVLGLLSVVGLSHLTDIRPSTVNGHK